MTFEVERKFHVDDLGGTERALRALGVTPGLATAQRDTYLSHPARDFSVTDEAFRLRRDANGFCATYKGPKIDPTTKTRVELELRLPSDLAFARDFQKLLGLLGFETVTEIAKHRRVARVDQGGVSIEVALDEVEGLGAFVEIEILSEEAGLSVAREHLADIAQALDLTRDERRSYCELTLAKLASEPGDI